MAEPRGYYQDLVYAYFKNDYGEDYQLTDGQAEMFRLVYEPEFTRVGLMAYTQYGKSEVTALALDKIACDRKEKILIVSPTTKQSKIIMRYVIDHLFDHPYLKKSIDFENTSALERLQKERSKKRITFVNGSEIFILTANAREVNKEAKNLMGFGASVVVVDERGLLPQEMYSKIVRMVGGVRNGKIIQLGNAFPGNGFENVFESDRYESLIIDYKQGLKEGRITQEFLDEAKEECVGADWEIFYECKFPSRYAENSVIPSDWVDLAVNQDVSTGEREAGLDVARFGGDKTAYCLRSGGQAKKLITTEQRDTMEVVGWALGLVREDKPTKLRIDSIGIGAGVVDRFNELELDCEVDGVNVGKRPDSDAERDKFKNLKSQVWWHLRDWFKPVDGRSDISIPDDKQLIEELKNMRYSYDSSRRIKIESKEEFKKRVGRSPDKGDALALAFYPLTKAEPQFIM